ncbi:hypothetical protein [uncultured Delftia sp.]|jgi:hypothetical protein|uniref:hypothetical protein n=1 Tax=uncultured Delftia sp. TaxID=191464 RepID=UPI002594B427|nr:hypothetical protein [uncultured Delftia sp.]
MSEHKGLLVVKFPGLLGKDAYSQIDQKVSEIAKSQGLHHLVTDGGADASLLPAGLDGLIQEMRAQREAMQAQTEVIGQLAASNFALVQAMAQDGEMGDDLPPTRGLNGKPL